MQNSLQKDSFLINTTSIIRGKPVLITMLIGVAFALVAIIFLILIKLLRGRRSNQPDNCNHHSESEPSTKVTQINDTTFSLGKKAECDCDNSYIDEVLLSSKFDSPHQIVHSDNPNYKGHPDIIPSFKNCSELGFNQKIYCPLGKL